MTFLQFGSQKVSTKNFQQIKNTIEYVVPKAEIDQNQTSQGIIQYNSKTIKFYLRIDIRTYNLKLQPNQPQQMITKSYFL